MVSAVTEERHEKAFRHNNTMSQTMFQRRFAFFSMPFLLAAIISLLLC